MKYLKLMTSFAIAIFNGLMALLSIDNEIFRGESYVC